MSVAYDSYMTGTSGATRGHSANESHLHSRRKHLHHRIHQDEPERTGTLGPGRKHLGTFCRWEEKPKHRLIAALSVLADKL